MDDGRLERDLAAAVDGEVRSDAGTRAAFLAVGGSGLAGAAFGALRLPVRRHPQPASSREQSSRHRARKQPGRALTRLDQLGQLLGAFQVDDQVYHWRGYRLPGVKRALKTRNKPHVAG